MNPSSSMIYFGFFSAFYQVDKCLEPQAYSSQFHQTFVILVLLEALLEALQFGDLLLVLQKSLYSKIMMKLPNLAQALCLDLEQVDP